MLLLLTNKAKDMIEMMLIMTTTAESAVTRLRKETAKTRIEVVAVPVGSHVGKTFYQVFRQNLFKFRQSLILEKRQKLDFRLFWSKIRSWC